MSDRSNATTYKMRLEMLENRQWEPEDVETALDCWQPIIDGDISSGFLKSALEKLETLMSVLIRRFHRRVPELRCVLEQWRSEEGGVCS